MRVTAADLLGVRVLPFFAAHDTPLNRIPTDRGSAYCGAPDRHPDELYLAIEGFDHTRTTTKSPQTNGICERFHKTLLNEFYRVTFRKVSYQRLEHWQSALDAFLEGDNRRRTHQGRWCYGTTPMATCEAALPLARKNGSHRHQRATTAPYEQGGARNGPG